MIEIYGEPDDQFLNRIKNSEYLWKYACHTYRFCLIQGHLLNGAYGRDYA